VIGAVDGEFIKREAVDEMRPKLFPVDVHMFVRRIIRRQSFNAFLSSVTKELSLGENTVWSVWARWAEKW
jgi:hypothetical protein